MQRQQLVQVYRDAFLAAEKLVEAGDWEGWQELQDLAGDFSADFWAEVELGGLQQHLAHLLIYIAEKGWL